MLTDPFEPEDNRRPGAATEAPGRPARLLHWVLGTFVPIGDTTTPFNGGQCPVKRKAKGRFGPPRLIIVADRRLEPRPSVPASVGHWGGAGSEADDVERSSVFVSVFRDVQSMF